MDDETKHALTRREASAYCGISPATMASYATRGGGPVMTRISARKIVYLKSDLDQWLGSRRAVSTTEAAPDQAGGLSGMYGHVLHEGYADRQFKIVRPVGDKWLVQWMSWATGAESTCALMDGSDLANAKRCALYLTDADMRDAWERGLLRCPDDEFQAWSDSKDASEWIQQWSSL